MLTLTLIVTILLSWWSYVKLDYDHPGTFGGIVCALLLGVGIIIAGVTYGVSIHDVTYHEDQIKIAEERLDSLVPVYTKAQVEAVETELAAFQLARPNFGTSYPTIGVAETIKWTTHEVAKLQHTYLQEKTELNATYRDANTALWLIVPWSILVW